ncbi:MAG: hypothetical protein M1832_004041 [Thelocarpon impressellum]|nr:MAG: hypothetical protein M1832_004041 [Thelocarpon impressellum]
MDVFRVLPNPELLLQQADDAAHREAFQRQGITYHPGSPLWDAVEHLNRGEYELVLVSPTARFLLGHEQDHTSSNLTLEACEGNFSRYVASRLHHLSGESAQPGIGAVVERLYHSVFIGYAAMLAFLQSNVTGPPLSFSSREVFFGALETSVVEEHRRRLIAFLTVDGAAAYPLIPNVELLSLAIIVLNDPAMMSEGTALWRLRVNFLHQRMLTETVSTLQALIFDDLSKVDSQILSDGSGFGRGARAQFLIERAAIRMRYGFESKARDDLDKAATETGFKFALTGRLGKRTKYQEKDISQLVVLARSASDEQATSDSPRKGGQVASAVMGDAALAQAEKNATEASGPGSKSRPNTLDLNDDTLLEAIAFSEKPKEADHTETLVETPLPPELAGLEPSKQPGLKALDSIILLSIASSITDNSPPDILTREETLPYATRVIEGGSDNWQVYTQALLVRSRIEGYRSRTVERGVLQLQALVDQVLADTSGEALDGSLDESVTTFLPKAAPSESAPVTERLRYIYQLCSPTRWELEAELAARWVSLGGLRTALEIYERLHMWAEVSLCWGGLEREDKAERVVRKQLFQATKDGDVHEEEQTWEGAPREPPPADAPRLYCILADIKRDLSLYEKAWEVSGRRYARAQRSLGKHYFAAKKYGKSAEAYAKSLEINKLNHGTWYAMGCAQLQLNDWNGAVQSFGRAVQLDDQDAESWSNLAAALLEKQTEGEEGSDGRPHDPLRNKRDALKALKRAAVLKHDSWRIWENLLIVAASTVPPSYGDIVMATKRLIDIRGPSLGEAAIEADVLEQLVRHIIDLSPAGYDAQKPGLARMVVELVDKHVTPLITTSRHLWQIIARLSLWRQRPAACLAAYEKAWRAAVARPGWASSTDDAAAWGNVVDATVELADAYESLGQRADESGSGAPVAKDWRFKARSAVRSVLGKGKEAWEVSDGWERLKECMEGLKG